MRSLPVVVLLFLLPVAGEVNPYGGIIGGISTLSADAGAQATPNGLRLSSYSPENGAALNVFAGLHLHNYFSVQSNYIWNRNDLLLNSSSSDTGASYQQARKSSQHATIVDFLIYFRRRGSRIRPYLGTGTGWIHLASTEKQILTIRGSPVLPAAHFSSNRLVLRSHVGIDVWLAQHLDFRYSFSETIGKNDISKHLSPPAPRRLANFQNLFGFVFRF
jgi:hypothetical protein